MQGLLAFLLINLACFVIAWTLAVRSPFYRALLAPPPAGRVGRADMIDGLRGWLALGVLFTHAANMHTYFSHGEWGPGSWGFYGKTGPVGVCLFFMVTAYLFWGRVLRTEGQLRIREFYLSRVRRIVPMYLASVLMVLAVVAFASGFDLRVGMVELAKQLRAWFSFGFMYAGDINGVRGAHYINAVYWTLAYEWVFYLVLPLLALCARGVMFAVMLGIAALYGVSMPVTLCFICGMVVATVVERRLIPFSLSSSWLTPLPVAALLLAFTYHNTFAPMPIVLLAVFFLFVVKDNSLFGLLATPGARLLGAVSYSIYLVHCIVLYCLVALVNALVPIRALSVEAYLAIVGVAAVATVLLSARTYRHIEHPFLSVRGGVAAPPSSTPTVPGHGRSRRQGALSGT
jgi:peptidoglycan/LPS O-acetylase OafA/YrhL